MGRKRNPFTRRRKPDLPERFIIRLGDVPEFAALTGTNLKVLEAEARKLFEYLVCRHPGKALALLREDADGSQMEIDRRG